MVFEDYWNEVWKEMNLPSEARKWLPESLTEETKNKLMTIKTEKVARIIEIAVDKIEHGAIDSIDKLVNAAIDR